MVERILSAYPLFVKDPYFSVWARDEYLCNTDTAFWTGKPARMFGIFEVEGKKFSFMGKSGAQPAEQTELKITAFSTDYTFVADGCKLEVRFISPLLPEDPEMISCPCCYMSYRVTAPAGKKTSVKLFVTDEICYENKAAVSVLTVERKGMRHAVMGLKRQLPMSSQKDVGVADWGYFYLTAEQTGVTSQERFAEYLAGGALTEAEDTESEFYAYASGGGAGGYEGKFLLSYDDTVSIYYFGEWLRGYYFRNGKSIYDAIDESLDRYEETVRALDMFDEKLERDCSAYGKNYINLARAALRQSVAAHKLVQNGSGELLFLSKECNSNGCIATLDVTYPSVPLFLLYNPQLVKGMMIPILKFAKSESWGFPFCPHDAGRYPYCNGQVYGAKEFYLAHKEDCTVYPDIYNLPEDRDTYIDARHMPVEECGNALIVMDLLLRHGETAFVSANYGLLKGWAEYLCEKGVVPENQLCTDDFAGLLDKNVNLAIKSAVALAAFAHIGEELGQDGSRYLQTARNYARSILETRKDGVLPLTFDYRLSSYSLKYNLYFDKLLGFGLFPSELCERETDHYLSHADRYGVALDERKAISKTDWLIWVAALTDDRRKTEAFIDMVDLFMKEDKRREPFEDYYNVSAGSGISFRNRTVQGAIFALLYRDSLKPEAK